MLKEELERILGMAPRDNYVTQKPSAITYMKEGKVVAPPVNVKPLKKKEAPSTEQLGPVAPMDSNFLGNEAMKIMAPNAPVRSNYVETLPSDIPESNKKTSPEKLETIKKQFKLPPMAPKKSEAPVKESAPVEESAPEQVESQPMEEAPVQKERSPAKVEEKIEKMKKDTGWADLLPALAPLLVGALMGGEKTGVASGVAGDYLLSNEEQKRKRNDDLENKLLEIEKTRIKTKNSEKPLNRRFQRTSVWDDETQRSVHANYDTLTGQLFDLNGNRISGKAEVGFAMTPDESDRRAAVSHNYKKQIIDYTPRENKETGLMERAGGGKIFKQTMPLNPVQRQGADKSARELTTSKSFQEARTALSGSEKVKGLLALKSPSALNSARLTILKMGGNVGATTDKDLELVQGDPSALAYIKRIEGRVFSGKPMLESDIEDLRRIADFYAKKARRDLNKSIELADSQYSKDYQAPSGTLKSRIYPQVVEAIPKNQDMVRVQNPKGKTGWMPKAKLEEALKRGENYKVIK